MKLNILLSEDEAIAAIGEYLRRTTSTQVVVDDVVYRPDTREYVVRAVIETSAPKGKTDCRNCGERGHNAQSCPKPKRSLVAEVDDTPKS